MKSAFEDLDWIDINEALRTIEDLTKHKITKEELILQCENNKCTAYFQLDNFNGSSLEPLEVNNGSYTFDCLAYGYHQITHPSILSRKSSRIEVIFHGDVVAVDGRESERHNQVDWKAIINPNDYEVRFYRKEIVEFCKKLRGATKELDPRERDSLLQIIYVIGKMNKDFDFFGSKSLAEAVRAKAKELKIKPLSPTTIDKHLSAAKDLCD